MLEMDVIETETNWLVGREYPGFTLDSGDPNLSIMGLSQLILLIAKEVTKRRNRKGVSVVTGVNFAARVRRSKFMVTLKILCSHSVSDRLNHAFSHATLKGQFPMTESIGY